VRIHLLGVIDSGVIGLSLLGDIRKYSLNHDIADLADCRNVAYGDKPFDCMCGLAIDLFFIFMDMGVQASIIACNTITHNRITTIRDKISTPVIGIESGVETAASVEFGETLAVLGAVNTLKSSKVEQLVAANDQTGFMFHRRNGLADVIVAGDLDPNELVKLASRYFAAATQRNVSTLVLGCTHYSLINNLIAKIAGAGVATIEPERSVAHQLVRRVTELAARVNPLLCYLSIPMSTYQR